MTPEGLEKLWRKTRGRIPHLTANQFQTLVPLCGRFRQPGARFWGVIDEKRRYEGMALVHCFNFGNTTVKFPWSAEAVNFGMRIPMQIVRSGTVRLQKTYRSLLHQVEVPFLVFGFEDASLADEQLQSGFLLTEPDTADLVTEREIVMLPGCNPPLQSGILFYFLTRRISFSAEPMPPFQMRGIDSPLQRFRLRMRDAMLLEPGWAVLILEKDRWGWGVVAA